VLCSGLRVHEVPSGHFLLIPALHTMPNTVVPGYLIKTFQTPTHHTYLVAHCHLPAFKLAAAVANFHLSQALRARGSQPFRWAATRPHSRSRRSPTIQHQQPPLSSKRLVQTGSEEVKHNYPWGRSLLLT